MTIGAGEAPLAALARRAGRAFPNLVAARARTEEALHDVRARVAEMVPGELGSIVLLGSWGRRELTPGSDDDWLLLCADAAGKEDAKRAVERLRTVLGGESRRPGGQRVFEAPVWCEDLVARIGLTGDDNRNFTRRMLLLLESVPATGAAVWERCWLRVLDGYLDEPLHSGAPPRFLLNDVMRYWRTMLVDFVGKARGREDRKTVLRNLKLGTSRKVLYAGGLLPALRSADVAPDAMRAFLRDQLGHPATDRLADAFLAYDAADAGARALGAYDEWIGVMADATCRVQLADMATAEADRSVLHRRCRALARELQAGLETLLFDTDLQRLVRRHTLL
jgi:hypothetical protein